MDKLAETALAVDKRMRHKPAPDNKPIGMTLYRATDGFMVGDWRGSMEEARQDTKDMEWKLKNIQTRKIHDVKQALIEALR